MQVVDYLSPDAAQQFVASLQETGFGVLRNHPLEQSRLDEIYRNWQSFFDGEDKHNYPYDPIAQDGYFSLQVSETAKGFKEKDIKEFYQIYPHGRIPEKLSLEIMGYFNDASSLAGELLGWIEAFSPPAVAAKYSEPLCEMIEDTTNTMLRVIHYPPIDGDEPAGSVRAAAHEDINLITLLPASNEPGLQVKLKSGEWMDVPCDWGNLIINIGDMLQEASGGHFPSTSHRVINPLGGSNFSNRSRISLPLFLHPRSEVVLSERYTQASYLDERLKELGIRP